MRLWIRIVLFWTLVLAILGAPQPKQEDNQNVGEAVPTAIRRFTRKMYFELAKKQRGNFVFSPYSIHMALSLLALGAPQGSKTRKELVRAWISFLHIIVTSNESIALNG